MADGVLASLSGTHTHDETTFRMDVDISGGAVLGGEYRILGRFLFSLPEQSRLGLGFLFPFLSLPPPYFPLVLLLLVLLLLFPHSFYKDIFSHHTLPLIFLGSPLFVYRALFRWLRYTYTHSSELKK